MNGAALIVGYCTAMVCTRGAAPLAGAGTLVLILPLTIWAGGAPLGTATVGVAACRLLGRLSLPDLEDPRSCPQHDLDPQRQTRFTGYHGDRLSPGSGNRLSPGSGDLRCGMSWRISSRSRPSASTSARTP